MHFIRYIGPNARLDVSARGFWSPLDKSFTDIRVFHPQAASYANMSIPYLYRLHETRKKSEYNARVIYKCGKRYLHTTGILNHRWHGCRGGYIFTIPCFFGRRPKKQRDGLEIDRYNFVMWNLVMCEMRN